MKERYFFECKYKSIFVITTGEFSFSHTQPRERIRKLGNSNCFYSLGFRHLLSMIAYVLGWYA